MSIPSKKSMQIVGVLVFVVALVILVLQWRADTMLANFLSEKTPKNMILSYSDLEVNLLFGNVDMSNISLEIQDEKTSEIHTKLIAEKFEIHGLAYLQILFNKAIDVENIILDKPKITHYPFKKDTIKKAANSKKEGKLKRVLVDEIEIKNGKLQIFKKEKDSVQFQIEDFNFTIFDAHTNLEQPINKIPFKYADYILEASDIFADLNSFETATIAKAAIKKEALEIEDILLSSKYSKKELSKYLTIERDYIYLKIPKVTGTEFKLGVANDRFATTMQTLQLFSPNADIYRDKLIPDDETTKPLYNKVLRELSWNLNINKVTVENGTLSYSEKIKVDEKEGNIFFTNLQMDINDLSNDENAKKTEIHVTSNVMDQAPLILDWEFDVNGISDPFTVSGNVKDFNTSLLNAFLTPSLNIKAEGLIEQMYFTFSGNTVESKGNMKMKYEDFEFKVLQKDRLKINKFLTTVGNIFVNDGSKADADGYRYGTIEATRETNKSFYNYLWLNVRSGMLSTLTK